MHRPRTKRVQIIRATIVYTVMITVILIGLTIGVLYTLGYRLNMGERTIEQGGLLQIGSVPGGARVTVDQRQLNGTTPLRVDATAGAHTLRLTRDGYRPWQKTITVDPGTVHWANYARLVPKEPEERTVHSFDSLHAVLPAYERNLLLAQVAADKPGFVMFDVSGDTPNTTNINLTGPVIDDLPKDGTFRLDSWDESERLVLLEHKADRQSTWLVMDTRSPDNVVDVSALLEGSGNLRQIMFNERNGRTMYVVLGDVLRRINTSSGELSAPIARGVTDIWQSDDGVVTYVTEANEDDVRSIGYYTHNADRAKLIEDVSVPDGERLTAVVGEYLGRQYLAVQVGEEITVSRLGLHSSDSNDQLSIATLTQITAANPPTTLAFSPHNRFVYMQHTSTFTTYDIELDTLNTTTVQGDVPHQRQLGWLDDYHLWSDRDETLRWYEFDGGNIQSIADIAGGFAPKLTENGRYMYVVQSDKDDRYRLVRVSLRL